MEPVLAVESVAEKPEADAQDEAFLEFVRKMPSEQELAAPEAESDALLAKLEATEDPQPRPPGVLNHADDIPL